MTRRSALSRLVGIVLVAAVLLGITIVQGNAPFLGLDLQGGVSVVLSAKSPDVDESVSRISGALEANVDSLGLGAATVSVDGTQVIVTPAGDPGDDLLDQAADSVEVIISDLGIDGADISVDGSTIVVSVESTEVSDDSIDQAISIIRNRVDAIGVAEPEITRQGKNIVVQIPGVEDPEAALELVGQTAELRFRPVLALFAEDGSTADDQPATTTTAPGETTTTVAGDPSATTSSTAAGDTTSSVAPEITEGDDTTTTTVDAASGGRSRMARAQDDPATTTTAPDTTAPDTTAPDTTAPADPTATTAPGETVPELTEEQLAQLQAQQPQGPSPPITPDDEDLPEATVVLPDVERTTRYQLGPTLVTGSALSGASAQLTQQGQWQVVVTFRGGAEGIDAFNAAAAQCSPASATCPPVYPGETDGALAIVLDHEVISAPTINEPNFDGSATISGNFTEDEARDLALVLRYGALPVELEPQTTVQVSATLGADALDAALISAAIAFVLVAIYMVAFYRLLGLLAMSKLVVEGALLWSLISYLGETQGLALTLAGITGIIVSIGVSVDSNIVYYEHLKEDIRAGRTLRSTVDRSFTTAFSTIVKADTASLIGAALLWWLTVGPVRGFAFYLGVATLLDLIAAWFFMHPAVSLATRSDLAQRKPQLFGMPAAPIVDGRPGTGGAAKGPDLAKAEAAP